jgi:hypothetical protein
MPHADAIIAEFVAAGFHFLETLRLPGHPFTFAVFSDYRIPAGSLRGQTISRLALQLPDDPMLPPPGIHTQPQFGLVGMKNIHTSPLGPAWAYWSRPIPGFRPSEGVPRILAHIQSVLRDA